jgi:2-polyprenyl-3-methyl-5-hydroxy-6-metoxy-1,4-benzoquinol methylase
MKVTQERSLKLELTLADLADLAGPDTSFEVIVSPEMISHLSNDDEVTARTFEISLFVNVSLMRLRDFIRQHEQR